MNKILPVAIAGHRDIRTEDKKLLKETLQQKILSFKKSKPNLKLLVGNAEGTDIIALEIAKEQNIVVIDLNQVCKRKATESDKEYYQSQGEYIIQHSDTLIVVWDGIFNGQLGGTSDIVRMALEAQSDIKIYQFPVPRLSNSIPVVYSPIALKSNPFPFQWNIIATNKKEKAQNYFVKLIRDFFKNQVFWTYILPLILIFIKLISGFVGYWQLKPNEGFLKTITTTILNFANKDAPNDALVISKMAGIGILICAFSYGFFVAMKSYRQNAKRWWWSIRGNFSLLWGRNESLAKDILTERPLIVISDSEIKFEEPKKYKAITVSPSLKYEDLYIEKAIDIFLNQASDADNIEKALEIEQHLEQKSIPNVFIQLNEEANIIYAQNILSSNFLEKCRFYSPTYLSVRNLLLQYSPYKFHWKKNLNFCHFSIFGFDVLGQTLLLELLKQIHFENNRQIIINIFCKNAEKSAHEFYALYPILKENSKISAYVWGNFSISFIELPQNTADLLNNMPQLFDNINEKSSTQIFFCLKDLVNSHLVEILLPSLDIQKEKSRATIEVFIYTSATSEIVQNKLEKHFNQLIPSVNVVCFTDTPSLAAIKDTKLDELAMRINAIYDTRIKNDIDMLKYWHEAIEKNKNSSRQAADHLWTKIKILGSALDWNFNKQEEYFEQNPEKLIELGDIEHRRWCAELLLRGHRPITEDTRCSLYKEISENWNKPEYEASKKAYIKVFKHVDLVPYNELDPVEAEKDLTQINAIPNLLHKLKMS